MFAKHLRVCFSAIFVNSSISLLWWKKKKVKKKKKAYWHVSSKKLRNGALYVFVHVIYYANKSSTYISVGLLHYVTTIFVL